MFFCVFGFASSLGDFRSSMLPVVLASVKVVLKGAKLVVKVLGRRYVGLITVS